MKLEKYNEIMRQMEPPAGLERNIYSACTAQRGKNKKPKRHRIQLTAACACMAALILAVGIPVLSTNPQTGESNVDWAGLTVKVKAGTVENEVTLMEGAKRLSDSGVELYYRDVEIDGEIKEVYAGSTGLGFQVDGENMREITFESEKQEIHCEYLSQNHPNGSAEYLWSGISIGMETEDFAKYVADIENPQKEELAVLLDDMLQKNLDDPDHEPNQMDNFVEMVQTTDIDFMSLNLTANVYYKGEGSAAFVRIENPGNEFQAPVDASSVTTVPGEPIDWVFSRETRDYLSAIPKKEVDFSRLNDTIQMTALMEDGTRQTIRVNIRFDENGQCSTEFVAE